MTKVCLKCKGMYEFPYQAIEPSPPLVPQYIICDKEESIGQNLMASGVSVISSKAQEWFVFMKWPAEASFEPYIFPLSNVVLHFIYPIRTSPTYVHIYIMDDTLITLGKFMDSADSTHGSNPAATNTTCHVRIYHTYLVSLIYVCTPLIKCRC